MACYSTTRHGFITITDLMANVDAVLTSNSHPNLTDASVGYFTRITGTPGTGTVIYESTVNVDPLANYTSTGSTITSAWRLVFIHHDSDRMSVCAGTKLQYRDDGTIAYLTTRALSGATNKEAPGAMGAPWTGTSGAPAVATDNATLDGVFLNRQQSAGSPGAYPMSWTLTLTNRGVFFAVWEGSQEEATQTITSSDLYGTSPIHWFLVQRPVDRVTGHVRGGGALRGSNDPTTETSRCPVFCVFGVGGPNSYRRFVVRENDVLTPSRKKLVSEDQEDSPAMINPRLQNCITENGEFVVTFLTNLSTPRYRYSDELDMVGTVAAEVVGPGTSINVKVYNEASNRTYTALYANDQFGKGMRLMVLTAANAVVENSHITA